MTTKQWLQNWDEGKPVTTVEMGGLGPMYEQAIQATAVEVLRALLRKAPPKDDDGIEAWWSVNKDMFQQEVFHDLPSIADGLSGAQWGAASNLAFILYRRGPEALEDEEIADRLIEVRKGVEA